MLTNPWRGTQESQRKQNSAFETWGNILLILAISSKSWLVFILSELYPLDNLFRSFLSWGLRRPLVANQDHHKSQGVELAGQRPEGPLCVRSCFSHVQLFATLWTVGALALALYSLFLSLSRSR